MNENPKINLFSLKAKLILTLVAILFFTEALNFVLRTDSVRLLHVWRIIIKIEIFGDSFIHNTKAGSPLVRDDKSSLLVSLREDYLKLEKLVPLVENVYITEEDGVVRQSIGHSKEPLDKHWQDIIAGGNEISEYFSDNYAKCIETNGNIFYLVPAKDFFNSNGMPERSSLLIFEIDGNPLYKYIRNLMITRFFEALTISIVAGLILLLLFMLIPIFKNNKILNFNIYFIIFAVYIATHSFCQFINIESYKNTYVSITEESGRDINRQVHDIFQLILNSDMLSKQKPMILEDIRILAERSKEIESINIFDSKGAIIFGSAGSKSTAKLDLNSKWQSNAPLYGIKNGKEIISGYSNVTFDKAYIESDIRKYFHNCLTVGIVSLLIQAQLIYLVLMYFMGKMQADKLIETDKSIVYCQQIRFLAFLLLFASSLCVTFIPLYMGSIYEPLFGVSKDIMMSLPISFEMFFIAVFTLIAGFAIRRSEWKTIFSAGVILLTVGYLYSAYTRHPLSYILSRGIVGSGLGCCFTAMSVFVSEVTTKDNKASGNSNLESGIASGALCGGVIGALLAARFGYRATFIMAASMFPVILSGFILFRARFNSPSNDISHDEQRGKLSISEMLGFLKKKRIYSVLSSLVITAAVVFGFVFYLIPVYLNSIGYDQSEIGRVNLLFGLSVICFMRYFAQLVDKNRNSYIYIVVSVIVGICGLASFIFIPGIAGVVFSVILIGLASMIAGNSQYAYFMNSRETVTVGEGPALGLYSMLFSFGQMLGPLILGGLVTLAGYKDGVVLVCFIYLIAILPFAVIAIAGRSD